MTLENIIELKPEHYFDLSTFRYKDIFENVDVVWDVLKNLPNYLANKTSYEIHPEAKIHPTAIIEGKVAIGKGTVVEAYAVIKGPTIIGENCLIQPHSHLRGNIVIGDYTRIGNYTEIFNSILLGGKGMENRERANCSHFNYVGYSILGVRSLLGARVTTSPLRLDRKTIKVSIDNQIYETNLPKLGAMVGDDAYIGCHTLLNPGSLLGKNTWISGPPLCWRGYLPPGKFAKGKNTHYEIVDKKPID